MKKASTLTFILTFLSIAFSISQNDLNLRIHHKLDGNDFAFQATSVNNIGNKFNLHRMQYYLSQFILVHDGGAETALPGIYALVNAGESTVIDLGAVNFTTIEGIRYSVGVDSAVNHLDPAQYTSDNPLAPQSPSMHWGWAAGYRFVCMEGFAGSTLSTLFEIHALGDNNYHEVSLTLDATEEGGEYYIDVDGDYAGAIRNIDVTTGVVSHGDVDEAAALLLNFRDHVFTPSPKATGIFAPASDRVAVYPNPSNGIIYFGRSLNAEVERIEITNYLGQLVKVVHLSLADNSIELPAKGVYLLTYFDEGTRIGSSKVVVH